jgi:hypothetical protein
LVIRRYLKLKAWRDTERIVVGGGFRASRIGELVVGRTAVILKADKIDIDLVTIRHDPDEAGLIGAIHLAPAWIFKGHDAILAVDIGGTNIRAGVVEVNLKGASDLSKAKVWKFDLWRHAEEEKLSRDEAVTKLAKMLNKLIERAKKASIKLTPFIGIGCPGLIREDGSIDRGAQNLPGKWASRDFHLPAALAQAASAQRRGRARSERSPFHARRKVLGRADHRDRAGQRAFHQPEDARVMPKLKCQSGHACARRRPCTS